MRNHQSISFSDIEAEVLAHRLAILADLDEADFVELFTRGEDFDLTTTYAGRVAREIGDGKRIIALDVGPAAEALAEALEGGTLLEAAEGEVSAQKMTAYRSAYRSAATKIERVLGRPIFLPLV